MATVILFDIDGTLVSAGRSGRNAICAGLEAVVGRSVEPDELPFSFAGMTDRSILRRALQACGVAADNECIDEALEAYLQALPGEVSRASNYRVHPGVEPLLQRLSSTDSAIGLGTGNARRGARIKLERAGLHRYFSFGGYGCESEHRAEVIARGIERGARRLGETVSTCGAVIVGDTPADVEAAHDNGADCLAVATGSYSLSELEDCESRWLVESLRDDDVREVLGVV